MEDREHDDRRLRRKRLKPVIEKVLADQGIVLISAFSIGLPQELLYEAGGNYLPFAGGGRRTPMRGGRRCRSYWTLRWSVVLPTHTESYSTLGR